MTDHIRSFAKKVSLISAIALLFMPLAAHAQSVTVSSSPQSTSDRWLHVRVISSEAKGETVRVNVPLEMAEKVLPTINRDRLHSGKVQIGSMDCHGVDLRALLDAVRSSKDGEFVTVQSDDADVRVAKESGYLLVHVTDKSGKKSGIEKHDLDKTERTKFRPSRVEVKVPMKVVDALLSTGKDELDLVAALHALSAQGDTELVSVKSDDNTVRVWLDSKNVTD
jgi:hypothetical protein